MFEDEEFEEGIDFNPSDNFYKDEKDYENNNNELELEADAFDLDMSTSEADMNLNDNNDTIELNIDEKEIKKKLTKEDLKTIQLPIFDCIYCANERISFAHLLSEQLSKIYLNCTSIFDIRLISEVIETDLLAPSQKETTNLVKNFVLNHSEYLTKFYSKTETNYASIFKKFSQKQYQSEKKPEKEQQQPDYDKQIVNTENDNLISKYLRIDLTRKICYSDIEFEEEPFDIWNCSYLFDKEKEAYNETGDEENRNDEIERVFNKKTSLSFCVSDSYSNSTFASSMRSQNEGIKRSKSTRQNIDEISLLYSGINFAKSLHNFHHPSHQI